MIACINGNLTTIQNPSQLIQGTVGQKMRVAIPEEMQDLAVTAVFTAGSVQRDVAVLGEEITIPWEVLADPAQDLRLCFHASSANGQRVFTTSNSDPLKILPSTPPSGQAPEAPTPARADQIQALAEDALAAAQSVRRDADRGAFDGTDGVNGQDGISPLVAVREISGGHTISITDAEGVKSFDVLDGADGEVLQSDLDELEASVADTLETKADIDGSYDDMTVGNARQLVSTVYTNDRTPYLFRTAGGSADIGDRLTEKIVGGTVAWNQLIRDGNFSSGALAYWYQGSYDAESQSYSNLSVSDNILTQTYLQDTIQGYKRGLGHTLASAKMAGHKYLLSFEANYSFICACGLIGMATNPVMIDTVTVGEWKRYAGIVTAENGSTYIDIAPYEIAGHTGTIIHTGDTVQFRNFCVFDLTQMFGSAIADYISTLETSNKGAGMAYFSKLFPKPYYAYDAGTLMSVKASAHKTVGFNTFDYSTGKAKVAGGNVYQITGTYTSLSLDGEAITPDESGCFTPPVSGEITVAGGNASDTCIHLKWDGERDGEYEAYVQHTYALDSDLELRGIPKLDANNSLYYDGDEYASDGTVTRKYKEITASVSGTGIYDTYRWFVQNISDIDKSATKGLSCNVFPWSATWKNNVIVIPASDPPRINYVLPSDTTIDTVEKFNQFLSNNNARICYRITTPTTESADAFQSSQIVDDFGTEEYVDAAVAANTRDVAVPVGHDTLYQNNLRAKLEMAPESPGSNGDYIVRHTHGQNRYIAYTDGGRISSLEERLPAPPSVEGSYCLKVTISDGAAQYIWAAC